MIRAPYITDDLREGRLVAPFSLTIEDTPLRWRLIYRPEARSHAAFRTFRRWLLAKARAES